MLSKNRRIIQQLCTLLEVEPDQLRETVHLLRFQRDARTMERDWLQKQRDSAHEHMREQVNAQRMRVAEALKVDPCDVEEAVEQLATMRYWMDKAMEVYLNVKRSSRYGAPPEPSYLASLAGRLGTSNTSPEHLLARATELRKRAEGKA